MKEFYAKRIININLNITIASLLSTIVAVYPIKYVANLSDSMTFIVFSAFAIDSILDGIIFSILHLISNKNKKLKHYITDINQIQTQRIILSVIYFIFAVGLDYILMIKFDISRTTSFVFAYVFALIVTRTIHTLYGLKTGLFEEKYK